MLSIRMLQFSKMTYKSLIKMQISPIKNPNFEKPSRNLSNRTKEKILKKNFFEYLSKKFGSTYAQSPRKCSNIEILAKIEGKRSEFFFENLRRAYKDLFQVKEKFKIISCLCTFNFNRRWFDCLLFLPSDLFEFLKFLYDAGFKPFCV